MSDSQECSGATRFLKLENEVVELKTTVATLKNQINGASTSSTKRKEADVQLKDSTKKFKSETETDSDTIYVYTDGVCTKTKGGNNVKAGLGVYFGENHHLNVSETIEGRQTLNRAKIQAVVRALEQIKSIAPKPKRIVLFIESIYIIRCMTTWIKKWRRNGWKTTSGDVKYKEDFKRLDTIRRGLNVEWVRIKHRVKNKGQEVANKLAVMAVKNADP